ncbi:MAG: hypothetical protein Q8N73_02375 [bacterium]|nr:hypothetical protein [bacterium]
MNFNKFLRISIVFLVIFAWIFSGWPQIWEKPQIPPEIKQAQAATRTIEQQINIIDQSYSNGNASYFPTDNALGLIRWDSAKYNGDTVYFEAVIACQPGLDCPQTVYAALFSSTGTQVTNSEVSTSSIPYVRIRSSALTLGTLPNLESGIDYTVKIQGAGATARITIKSARLIIVQSDATSITDTQTQIEVGDNSSTTATTYTDLTEKKIYLYDANKFNPVPATTTFEATIKGTEVTINESSTTAATTTNWTVPSGVTSITVRVWGGGGAGGAGGDADNGGAGGGGGFVQDTISVTEGQLFTIVVGGGGTGGTAGSAAALDGAGGGGGGHSAFIRQSDSTYLLIGGGGGGGGSGSEVKDVGGSGGGGGIHSLSGVTGDRGADTAAGGCGGEGASSTAPGAGGACLANSPNGSSGSNMTGGAGGSAGTSPYDSAGGPGGNPGNGGAGGSGDGEDFPGGGGGGGGRYGGGGGEACDDSVDKAAGGGGGGSGLCADGTCAVEERGSGTAPGNTTDRATYCSATSGNGATAVANNTNGNPGVAGCVVISYTPTAAAYAALYTTGGSYVAGSEASTTNATWTRVRTSSSITLSDDTEYVVRIKTSSGISSIANAKIILDQSNVGGIDKVEMVHQYVNTLATDIDNTYTLQSFNNLFTPANWSGGVSNYYFEVTMRNYFTSPENVYAQLYNLTGTDAIDTPTNSEISTTSTSYVRVRSPDLSDNTDWPDTASNLDIQIKTVYCDTPPCPIANISTSWLVIQASGLTAAVATVSCSTDISTTDFQTLTSGSISTSAPDATTTMTCANSAAGCTMSIQDTGTSTGAISGLSATAANAIIESPNAAFSASTTLAAGTEGFGLLATTTSAGSGATLTIGTRYNSTGNWDANIVGGASTTAQTLATANSSTSARVVRVRHKAAISDNTLAGSYKDTIYYQCAGN